MARSKPSRARGAAARALPSPPTGQPKQTGPQGYPAPQTGGYTLGLDHASHTGSNYPQPNSANQPDPASTAAPGAVPGPENYRPNLAGNVLSPSLVNPGVDDDAGDNEPDYPQS